MASVEIDGGVELRQAMRLFTPNLAKNLERDMQNALTPVVSKARGFVEVEAPLSTWQLYSIKQIGRFPHYNALNIARGIYATTEPTKPNRKGWAYAAQIVNTTAAGAIYETAGRKSRNGRKQAPKGNTSKRYSQSANPNAGRQFIQSMPPLVNADTRLKIMGASGSGYKKAGRGSRKFKGRLIYKAWAQDQGKAGGAVNSAIDKSIQEFNRKTKNVFGTRKAA